MKVPVLLPNIFDYPFTYKNKLAKNLQPGDFVKVPFGKAEQTGVVWNFEQKVLRKIKLRQISKKLDIPRMSLNMIKFIQWFSNYNMVPLGMSFKMVLLGKTIVEKPFNQEFKQFQILEKLNKFKLNYEQ